MQRLEGVVNKISKLRNTTLGPYSLNTIVAIVTSSPADLLRNRVPARVCYLLTESGVQM